MSAPPQLSLVWFAPGERTLATAIMVLFGNIGSGIAYLLGLIVTSDLKLMTLIYIEAVASLITAVLVYVYFPDGPPTPPSPSTKFLQQYRKYVTESNFKPAVTVESTISISYNWPTNGFTSQNDTLTPSVSNIPSLYSVNGVCNSLEQPQQLQRRSHQEENIWRSLRLLLTNPSFMLLSISAGLLSGGYSGWQGVLTPILLPLGYSNEEVNWLGFCSIVIGCIGAVVIGKLTDLFFVKRLKLLLIIGFLVTLVLFVWFSASANPNISLFSHRFWIILFVCTLGSVALNGIVPIFYEFGVELSYPVPGGTSGSILTVLV
jgi:predicted MFS family arabinose efflux permease